MLFSKTNTSVCICPKLKIKYILIIEFLKKCQKIEPIF